MAESVEEILLNPSKAHLQDRPPRQRGLGNDLGFAMRLQIVTFGKCSH